MLTLSKFLQQHSELVNRLESQIKKDYPQENLQDFGKVPAYFRLLLMANLQDDAMRILQEAIWRHELYASGNTGFTAPFVVPVIAKEQIVLPDHYECPLSLAAMNNPVPVVMENGLVRYFEKKFLMHAVEINPINPLDREPLTPEVVSG